MRKLRLSLVGTVMLTLLGGLGGAVAAQDDEMTGTRVTGVVSGPQWPGPWPAPTEEGGATYWSDWRVERPVEWSDPRLPSMMTTVLSISEHRIPADIVQTWAATHRLDGPDGAWTGTERGVNNLSTEPGGRVGLLVLTGEGAYEGWTAVLATLTEPWGEFYEGFILEGHPPAMPDPVEPPAE